MKIISDITFYKKYKKSIKSETILLSNIITVSA